jgi:hypothetical protein
MTMTRQRCWQPPMLLEKRGDTPRLKRNRLIFLAP